MGLNSLANSEKTAGDFDAADRDYREALRIAEAVDYDEGVAFITGNLASLALTREDWPEAETLAHRALPFSESIGRQSLIAMDCYYLAKALVRQGKKAEALPYARRAVDIFIRLEAPELYISRAILAECES
jgi:tetratricopeptide (TPR) repeat protein